MNPERLSKLQSQVRIGGKGSARRKKKIVRKITTTDDKKYRVALKNWELMEFPELKRLI